MPRALLLVALVCTFAAHARAQDGDDAMLDPSGDTALDEELPDELIDTYPVPDEAPELDDVAEELRYYPAGQEPRIIVNDTEAPRRPTERDPRSDESYVPAGVVHSTIAVRVGSLGAFQAERPVTRLGALYLIDIRPWEDSVYRMRFGVGFSAAISAPVLLTHYARLLPVSVDLARALVFRFGADLGLAHLLGVEARLVLGPAFELVVPIDDGHVEIGLQTSFPFLVGDTVDNLWTLGLILAYIF